MSLVLALLSVGLVVWSATRVAGSRKRWLLTPGRGELDAWAGQRGFRVSDGDDLAIADDVARVLDVGGSPDDLGPLTDFNAGSLGRPEVGKVLVGPGRVLVIETWARGQSCLFVAAPSPSDWVSLELDDGVATGAGATAAVTAELLAGLAEPARIRCGLGWSIVVASGALDMTATDGPAPALAARGYVYGLARMR